LNCVQFSLFRPTFLFLRIADW